MAYYHNDSLTNTMYRSFIVNYSNDMKSGYTHPEYYFPEKNIILCNNDNNYKNTKIHTFVDILYQAIAIFIILNLDKIVIYFRNGFIGMHAYFDEQLNIQAINDEYINNDIVEANDNTIDETNDNTIDETNDNTIDESTNYKNNKNTHTKSKKNSNSLKFNDLESTINSLGRVPEVGDIIKFMERNEADIDTNMEQMEAIRSISTYGKIPIEPTPGFCDSNGDIHEGELYLVLDINSNIPNNKIRRKNLNTTNLHVVPVSMSAKKIIFEASQRVFWYIDFNNLVIRQHESGIITHFIDNLTIVGHDDRFNDSDSEIESDCDSHCSKIENDYELDYDYDYKKETNYTESNPDIDEDYQDYMHQRSFYSNSEDDNDYEKFKIYDEYGYDNTSFQSSYYGYDPNFNDGDY